MLMMRRGNAFSIGSCKTRMKPARMTSSTPASRNICTSCCSISGSKRVRNLPGGKYAFATPNSRAMSRIGASSTSETTRRASAGRSPDRIRSKIARQLLPFPDPRIPIGSRFILRAVYRLLALTDLFDQFGSRITCLEWNYADLSSDFLEYCTLLFIQCLRGVISAFAINGGADCSEKLRGPNFWKDRDQIHAF